MWESFARAIELSDEKLSFRAIEPSNPAPLGT